MLDEQKGATMGEELQPQEPQEPVTTPPEPGSDPAAPGTVTTPAPPPDTDEPGNAGSGE